MPAVSHTKILDPMCHIRTAAVITHTHAHTSAHILDAHIPHIPHPAHVDPDARTQADIKVVVNRRRGRGHDLEGLLALARCNISHLHRHGGVFDLQGLLLRVGLELRWGNGKVGLYCEVLHRHRGHKRHGGRGHLDLLQDRVLLSCAHVLPRDELDQTLFVTRRSPLLLAERVHLVSEYSEGAL